MKKIIPLIVVIIVVVSVFRLISKPQTIETVDENADLILFWGDGCPHCKTVEEFIKRNNIDSKLKINRKEVYYNRNNQRQLEETAKKCPNLNTSGGMGIPFAYVKSSGQCLVGDTPLIDFFKSRLPDVK